MPSSRNKKTINTSLLNALELYGSPYLSGILYRLYHLPLTESVSSMRRMKTIHALNSNLHVDEVKTQYCPGWLTDCDHADAYKHTHNRLFAIFIFPFSADRQFFHSRLLFQLGMGPVGTQASQFVDFVLTSQPLKGPIRKLENILHLGTETTSRVYI